MNVRSGSTDILNGGVLFAGEISTAQLISSYTEIINLILRISDLSAISVKTIGTKHSKRRTMSWASLLEGARRRRSGRGVSRLLFLALITLEMG